MSQEQTEDVNAALVVCDGILMRHSAAQNELRLEQERRDLEDRVEDWKNHNPQNFGKLLVCGTFTVIKGDGRQDVEREVRRDLELRGLLRVTWLRRFFPFRREFLQPYSSLVRKIPPSSFFNFFKSISPQALMELLDIRDAALKAQGRKNAMKAYFILANISWNKGNSFQMWHLWNHRTVDLGHPKTQEAVWGLSAGILPEWMRLWANEPRKHISGNQKFIRCSGSKDDWDDAESASSELTVVPRTRAHPSKLFEELSSWNLTPWDTRDSVLDIQRAPWIDRPLLSGLPGTIRDWAEDDANLRRGVPRIVVNGFLESDDSLSAQSSAMIMRLLPQQLSKLPTLDIKLDVFRVHADASFENSTRVALARPVRPPPRPPRRPGRRLALPASTNPAILPRAPTFFSQEPAAKAPKSPKKRGFLARVKQAADKVMDKALHKMQQPTRVTFGKKQLTPGVPKFTYTASDYYGTRSPVRRPRAIRTITSYSRKFRAGSKVNSSIPTTGVTTVSAVFVTRPKDPVDYTQIHLRSMKLLIRCWRQLRLSLEFSHFLNAFSYGDFFMHHRSFDGTEGPIKSGAWPSLDDVPFKEPVPETNKFGLKNEQYVIYLFDKILLCCKEVNPSKKQNKMMSMGKNGPNPRRKPALALKGRIFMQKCYGRYLHFQGWYV